MKKLALLLILIVVASCKKDSDSTKVNRNGKTILTGHFNNLQPTDSLRKADVYYTNMFSIEDYVQKEIKIDENGNFSTEIEVKGKQDINLYFKKGIKFIVSPNDSIHIEADIVKKDSTTTIDNIVFKGDGSTLNNNLIKVTDNSPFKSSDFYKKLETLQPNDYKKYHDSVFSDLDNYYNKELQNKSYPEDLKQWITTQKVYEPLTKVVSYKMYRQMYTRKPMSQIIIDSTFYNPINELPVLSEKDFINPATASSFTRYYYYHLKNEVAKGVDIKNTNMDSLFIKSVIQKFPKNKILAQSILFHHLSSNLKNYNIKSYETLQTDIDGLFKDSEFGNTLTSTYKEVKQRVENPVLPEGTELLSFKTNDGQKILNEIIKNANGKIVYIDNWATWCGPCKREFKEATPKLKKKFKDNIEYIYLCHQSVESHYKPTISKYKIAGKHYFMNKEQTESLAKLLNITGFPTYSIINKKGKILHSGFEFRPSIPKTTEILTKLIKE